jgi:hypothetical protein
MAPFPDNPPTVSLAFNLSCPGPVTVTAAASETAAPPASVKIPSLTTTAPVKVFAPLSVNSPTPDLVNPAEPPPTGPLSVTPTGFATVTDPESVPAPLNVRDPEFVASPNVTEPAKV